MNSELIIPCHWDWKIMQKILDKPFDDNDMPVTEVYGVLGHGGPVGHGRATSTVPDVKKENATYFRRQLAKKNISFTYLLNAPCTIEKNTAAKKRLDDYLNWIFDAMKPDALMISSPDLMSYVRNISQKIPIHISTIAGVKTTKDLQKYLPVNPTRVVVHHDLGKDWNNLQDIITFGNGHGMDIELLVNESCLLHCENRHIHYGHLAKRPKNIADIPFMATCNYQKLLHPREFLLSGGAIRPEDLGFYESLGVRHFKISGRDKPSS
jgi:collagenase-like PrtC family protease